MLSSRPVEPLRHPQVSGEASGLLATEGESSRFEFKQTANAVTPDVLVAAANWAAMNGEEFVTLLVGVAEHEDPVTGLVTGEITGLASLTRAIHVIQSRCLETEPVPVGVTFIEEGTATAKPFLRLKIRPTAAPHYDTKGRRVTRNNASTRPLTDQELLDLYLDREAEKFEQRFQRTASEVLDQLRRVASGVDELLDDLGYAGSAASDAVNEAQESKYVAERTERSIGELHDCVEQNASKTPVSLFYQLGDKRLEVWRAFAHDAAARPTKTTENLIDRLAKQLELPIDGNAWMPNLAEMQFWEEVLERRGVRGTTMTGWMREIAARERFEFSTVWPLGDEVAELRADVASVRQQAKRTTRKSRQRNRR